MRKLIGPNTYDQMFPPTFNERFGGAGGGTGGGGGGPATFGERFGALGGGGAGGGAGPTFRKGVGPGRTGRPGAGAPGAGGDPRGLEGYIRQKATDNGIDPDTAVAVARSEGLNQFTSGIRGETSYGAFQLHTGGGLGDTFKKETGLDPSDPANERATIDFALKNAAKGGWGPWHGAANTGIGPWAGIGGRPGVPRMAAAGAPGGEGGYTGVGGYNFMGSQRAAAMGMGDVTPFSANAQMLWPTGIPKGEGPESIRANKYAGQDMAGFLSDLHAAGAPLGQFAGAYVPKPRQHGYGNALDIETGFGSGPDNSPQLYAWAQAHPDEFAAIQAKHHMRNLDTSSGAGMHDWGHFEWSPTGRAAASNPTDRINMNAALSGAPTAVSGTGKIDVNVATPSTQGKPSGLFKRIQQRRDIQMQTSVGGPEQQFSGSPL